MKTPFLTCNWEHLVYINYLVNPEIVIPFLPKDLEPSLINGKTIISIVCFEFSKAKFSGLKIPFHQCFPEINIRVYAQRKDDPKMQGVYFISEMVPKLMTVFVAKYIFGEPFSNKNITLNKSGNLLNYNVKDENFFIDVSLEQGEKAEIFSEEEKFVIEKEFAFCGKAGKMSKLFKVQHRKWNLYKTRYSKFDLKKINHLPEILQNIMTKQQPSSIFATDGSYVEVFNLNI